MVQAASMLKWDFTLQWRYKIILLSLLSVIIYYLALLAIPDINNDEFKVLFLFFDPTLIGIMFIGALVLFEKSENVMQALTVTPMRTGTYFFSKIFSLTLLSTLSAFLFMFLVHGFKFDYLYMVAGIILSSVFLILLGFLLVARCKSINEYLLRMMSAFLLLIVPPLLQQYGIYETKLFYLWPSQASFILFGGVFESVSTFDTIYAVAYLCAWIIGCYILARKAFYKHIVLGGN